MDTHRYATRLLVQHRFMDMGKSPEQIASAMSITVDEVLTHLRDIITKGKV